MLLHWRDPDAPEVHETPAVHADEKTERDAAARGGGAGPDTPAAGQADDPTEHHRLPVSEEPTEYQAPPPSEQPTVALPGAAPPGAREPPTVALPDPPNLIRLKLELGRRWPDTNLLDMLKEVDLRIGFTQQFVTAGLREHLDRALLQKRLLLCLYALGTNTGLKRMSGGDLGESYKDLLYVRRRFLHRDALRNAIAQVANAIFQARLPHIWGEATTACASDSKKFGAWDQNLSLHHATLMDRVQMRAVRGKSIRGRRSVESSRACRART